MVTTAIMTNMTESMVFAFHKQWFLGFLFFKPLCAY